MDIRKTTYRKLEGKGQQHREKASKREGWKLTVEWFYPISLPHLYTARGSGDGQQSPTSSSTVLLIIGVHEWSGKWVWVVALPKSHNLTMPPALSSTFSTWSRNERRRSTHVAQTGIFSFAKRPKYLFRHLKTSNLPNIHFRKTLPENAAYFLKMTDLRR